MSTPLTLRLFEQADPAREIARRVLADGETAVGRGAGADWALPDPTKTLSRRHCVFTLREGRLSVRDESTNGVFGGDGRRLPHGAEVPLEVGDVVAVGAFFIRAEDAADEAGEHLPSTTMTSPNVSPAGRLLDAFCQGAQIDSSVVSAEEPSEVMRRVGAIYRQMVLGLGDLVNERAREKAGYGLDWTAVQALDNNPFRWAPPQRVAVDLLRPRDDGFLSGEAAVRSSFEDLRDHQQRLSQGWQAAQGALLAEISPDAVAKGVHGRFRKKSDALWAEFTRVHAAVSTADRPQAVAQAFQTGYRADPAPGE